MYTHQPSKNQSEATGTTKKPRIYPAYTFRASPTYNTWVKLLASDLRALRSEPEFRSQQIYFHLNHPIRFVRLVGVVVAIDDINAKYTVLTLDDGSGATVECKIIRLTPDVYNPFESPSNTMVQNINVRSGMGHFSVLVDNTSVDIGTVLKVKGTISEFRGMKQVELKRCWLVRTTNEEVEAWAEAAAFKRDVLDKPWHIGSKDHKKIVAEIKREKRRNREYERLRLEREERRRVAEGKRERRRREWEEYLAKREVRVEMRRRKEEAEMNRGALI